MYALVITWYSEQKSSVSKEHHWCVFELSPIITECTNTTFQMQTAFIFRWTLKMKAVCFWSVVFVHSVTMEKVEIHISDISHVTPMSNNYSFSKELNHWIFTGWYCECFLLCTRRYCTYSDSKDVRKSKDPGITQLIWLSYKALQHNHSINNSYIPKNEVHLLHDG
jgi:hypothetical protein